MPPTPPPDSSPTAPVAAVLLAAGASSRLGRNKLLLEIAGEPLVRRAARQAQAAGLSPILVVLGHERERVAAALAGMPVVAVENPQYEAGLATSFRAGIRAVPPECGAAAVVLPDMPLVGPEMIRGLVERYRETGSRLVLSLYGETSAPPTLYARALFPAALAAREGGRQVVREHRAEAAAVHHPAELLVDLDRPADLARLEALLAGG